MAEEQDDSQKTEAPSQRRLEEARAKGQLVVSREVATLLLFGAAALLALAAPGMGRGHRRRRAGAPGRRASDGRPTAPASPG